MKKAIRILAMSLLIMVVMAQAVMAQEVTDPNKVIKEETFVAGEDRLANEFHNSQIWRSDNYVKYLDGVVYNLNETVRIKKEIVDNYKWLSQYNPYYATLIPQAQADYDKAVAWVDYYKAYKAQVQADLKAKFNY